MDISHAPELKYVFGECDHERLSSYQYQNHVLLPHLEDLTLSQLPNLIGMCPEHCHAKWPPQSLWKLNIDNCGRLVTRWFNFEVGYDQRTHHLNENSPAKSFPSFHGYTYNASTTKHSSRKKVYSTSRDICRGCKLHAVKLRELDIWFCPNSAPSLKQIQ
ncbi:disease resistance protein (CC-NBS-LRR class) family protein, partial [Trifolium medium]|nr:disease resistance protein (CC-NBS-LRR class) family protein [Trifolium medium]